jgi:hypothetical protein
MVKVSETASTQGRQSVSLVGHAGGFHSYYCTGVGHSGIAWTCPPGAQGLPLPLLTNGRRQNFSAAQKMIGDFDPKLAELTDNVLFANV